MQAPLEATELKQEHFEPFGRSLNPQTRETDSQSEEGVFDFYVPFAERSGGWLRRPIGGYEP